MDGFISNLHFLNMVLVLASGTVSAVWGFILYFTSRPKHKEQASRAEAKAETSDLPPAETAVEKRDEKVSAGFGAGLNRWWRIALIVTIVIAGIQGLLGLTLALLGARPGTGTGTYWLHYVYGGLAFALIPGVWLYFNMGRDTRRDTLIFSIAALVAVAAALRALSTGLH